MIFDINAARNRFLQHLNCESGLIEAEKGHKDEENGKMMSEGFYLILWEKKPHWLAQSRTVNI